MIVTSLKHPSHVLVVASAMLAFLVGCVTQRTNPFADKVDSNNALKKHTPYIEYFSLIGYDRSGNGLAVDQVDGRKVTWNNGGHYYQVHTEAGCHTISFLYKNTMEVPPPPGYTWTSALINPRVNLSATNMAVRLTMRDGHFYRLKAKVKSSLNLIPGRYGPYTYLFEVTEHKATDPSESAVVTNLSQIVPRIDAYAGLRP
ncbi:MAG: hypothetical protein PHR35_13550 [Kiritimatiellae bacterium]|nr:hypothetical protein [Kiritimatiellia bacterium]